jgi:hypothetical protein
MSEMAILRQLTGANPGFSDNFRLADNPSRIGGIPGNLLCRL